jgi:polysaccharide deacetylase family protein (PEP-CTERM system associated)
MLNALCFDIDDLAYGLHMKCGSALPSEFLVEKETYGLLEFLDTLQVKATMFVPGYVAELFPALVKAMAEAGHEIGSHGHRHIDAGCLERKEFRKEVVISKEILEHIISKEVSVYKDPCWGITPRTPWAYDELIEAGYSVDNTAQPSLLESLGYSSDEMIPFRYKDLLTVIPVTSIRFFGKTMPLNGGLFTAYVPIDKQIKYFKRLNKKGVSFNYYCHPYELSPQGHNRYFWKRGSLRAGFYGLYFGKYRHYIALLAAQFRFGPLKDAYKEYIEPQSKHHEKAFSTSLFAAL